MLLRIYLRFWKPIVKKRKIVIIRGKIRCNKKFNGGYFISIPDVSIERVICSM